MNKFYNITVFIVTFLLEDPFRLSKDWEALFDKGEQCDLTIYGREEEGIPCHTIVMLARCRKVLVGFLLERDII